MIHEKGQNWNDFTPQEKRGRFIFKQEYEVEADLELKRPAHTRTSWVADECPTFTQQPEFLDNFIPEMD